MEYYSTIILYIALFTGIFFQIFLLLTIFDKNDGIKIENSKTEGYNSNNNKLPSATIIVPCFNEGKTVAKTMWSLADLNYPKNLLHILVVDDGSKDNTYESALKCKQEILNKPEFKDLNINVVKQKNGGKFTALNYGISISNTDLVGCLDADSTVNRDALIKMVPNFNDEKIMAVTPAIIVQEPKNYLQKIQKIEYNMGILSRYVFGKLNALHVTPGPFSIFRRKVFEVIGPFRHAHNTEDLEIAMRIHTYGFKIANCHNAHVYTITPSTIKKLYVQRTRWVSGFLKNTIDYRKKIFNPKLGNIATLTMPLAVISIVTIAGLTVSLIYNFGIYLDKAYQKMQAVGIDWRFWDVSIYDLDLFFLKTHSIALITTVSLMIAMFIIYYSQKMVEGKFKPSMHIVWYITLYIFISPLWVGKAIYNTALAKKVPWR